MNIYICEVADRVEIRADNYKGIGVVLLEGEFHCVPIRLLPTSENQIPDEHSADRDGRISATFL